MLVFNACLDLAAACFLEVDAKDLGGCPEPTYISNRLSWRIVTFSEIVSRQYAMAYDNTPCGQHSTCRSDSYAESNNSILLVMQIPVLDNI